MSAQTTTTRKFETTGDVPLQALAAHLAILVEAVPDGAQAQQYLRRVAVSLGQSVECYYRANEHWQGPLSVTIYLALVEKLNNLWEVPFHPEQVEEGCIAFSMLSSMPVAPNIARLLLGAYASIAARNFGYAKLVVHDARTVWLYLQRNAESDAVAGDEFTASDSAVTMRHPVPLAQMTSQFERELEAIRQGHARCDVRQAEMAEKLERVTALERKAREELQTATQAKRDFLSNVSHELRTPITIMQGYLGLLEQEMWGPLNADQRDTLEVAMRNLARLQRMINDLLDLSSLSSVQLLLSGEPLEMGEVLAQALAEVTPFAREKGITLAAQLDDLDNVVGDREKLVQLFAHLLENAVKFSDPGTTVTLTTRRQQQRLCIEVIDHGIGMSEGQLAEAFLPFVQGESGLTRRYGGLGTGLSLIQNLVTLHGGDISLRSTPGLGTTVTVSLPVLAEEE